MKHISGLPERPDRNFLSFMCRKHAVPYVCLVIAMFLWGGSFIALKIAFRHYDPMMVIFARMIIATICFTPFIGRFKKEPFRKKDIRPILIMGLFEPCLYFTFEAHAIVYTTPSQASMVTAMLPLMVAIAAAFILKERIKSRTVTGFILAIAGIIILSMTGDTHDYNAPDPPLGNFLEFMAMVSATGYTISIKKLTERYSAFFLTAVQALIGTIFFGLFVFINGTGTPVHISTEAVIAVLYLGVVVTMIAYFFYNYGVSKIPASQASSFVNLIPVFTILLSWIILKEKLSVTQIMAVGLVFTGVIISQKQKESASL